jgi:hypothetical protein
MAYGDPNYSLHFTGQTNASDNNPHFFFGSYDGLSDLNANNVGYLQILPSGNNARLYQTLAASAQDGVRLMSGASFYADFPPMKVSDLQTVHFANESAGNNASLVWALWIRNS